MTTQRRLGRGLAALLGDSVPESPVGIIPVPGGPGASPSAAPAESSADQSVAGVLSEPNAPADFMISIDEIVENPFQPRREFGEAEIASLAESLREHDMLQPILVRRMGDRWQLISGERRLRAAIRAGWKKVPARVRQANDRLVAELAIVENLQRKDLNPIEKALSFQRYLQEHRCTQDDLGQRIKIDRSTIANLMRLLELPDEIQTWLREGRISAGHARALLPLGDARLQIDFARRIMNDQISVRATEQEVQQKIAEEDGLRGTTGVSRGGRTRNRNSQLMAMERELRGLLGVKVQIRSTPKQNGTIVLHFHDAEEFERLRQALIDGATQVPQSRAG